jgi:hypothetical protein
VLVGILNELKRFNDRLDAAQPKPSTPSFDPAFDKSPEEIARIQALPNHSRLPAKANTRSHDGFERDYSAYHLPGTVYPYGRNV